MSVWTQWTQVHFHATKIKFMPHASWWIYLSKNLVTGLFISVFRWNPELSQYICYFWRAFRSFLDRRLKKQQHLKKLETIYYTAIINNVVCVDKAIKLNTYFVSLTTSTFGGDIGVLSFATGSSSCELITLNLKIDINQPLDSKITKSKISWFIY